MWRCDPSRRVETLTSGCNMRITAADVAMSVIELYSWQDVKWLGFDWGTRLTHASDYFGKFYEYALMLIKSGDAIMIRRTPGPRCANNYQESLKNY